MPDIKPVAGVAQAVAVAALDEVREQVAQAVLDGWLRQVDVGQPGHAASFHERTNGARQVVPRRAPVSVPVGPSTDQPSSRLGSQPTRSAEARSFSSARFWI